MVAVLAARLDPLPPAQFELVHAAREGVGGHDAGDVHDVAPMHAAESTRVEALLERGQALVEDIVLGPAVQDRVVVGRLDPVDGVDRHEIEPLSAPHDKTLQPLRLVSVDQPLQLSNEGGRGR